MIKIAQQAQDKVEQKDQIKVARLVRLGEFSIDLIVNDLVLHRLVTHIHVGIGNTVGAAVLLLVQ